jgi:hypothetical protein
MPSHQGRSEKTAREMFLEQAAAYFDEMKAVTENAPYGQPFNVAETFALQHGRELIRQSVENILQEQIDEHENKKRRRSVRNANRKNDTEATETKNE